MGAGPSLQVYGIPVSIALEDMGQNAIIEGVTAEGPFADCWFQCAYSRRYDVIRGLMGSVSSSGGKIVRTLPIAYPPSPNLFCTNVSQVSGIKPRVQPDGWPTYALARFQAHFTVPTWSAFNKDDPSGIPFTTTRFRASAEIFSPPGGAYYFPDLSGQPVPESSMSVVRSRIEITMTRHMLPFPPIEAIMTYDGTVNQYPVTIGDREFPRGCLLFCGGEAEPTADPSTGARTWDVTFNLMGNFEIDFNEFMGPDGEYHLVNTEADGSGDTVFEYADFVSLFRDEFGI